MIMKIYESRYSYDKYDHKEYKELLVKSLDVLKKSKYKYDWWRYYYGINEFVSNDSYFSTNLHMYMVDIINNSGRNKNMIKIYFSTNRVFVDTIKKLKIKIGLY